MAYVFTESTAISQISDVENNQVKITWTNGATYTYELENAERFVIALAEIVGSGASVGRFVNSQIQQNMLQLA
jgi:hypothetical protein